MSLIPALDAKDLDLQALLEQAAAHVASSMGAEHVAILLVSDTIDPISPPIYAHHAKEPGSVAPIAPDHEWVRRVMAQRKLCSDDALAGSRLWGDQELGVPMQSSGQIIGAIQVRGIPAGAIGPQHRDYLACAAHQLAILVENQRLRNDHARRIEQISIVNEIGNDVAAIPDIDQLLDRVVTLLQSRFHYYDTNVLLMEETSQVLSWRTGTRLGKNSAPRSIRIPMGEGIAGWVAGHGEPLRVNDVHADPRYFPVPELPDARSELAVPIMLGQRVLGVLDIQSDQVDAYDEDDVRVLQTLANQVAMALGNAEQLAQTEQRVLELAALRQVGLQLISTTDLFSVMEIIAESALRLMGAQDVRIYLYDAERDALAFGTARQEPGPRSPVASDTIRNTELAAGVARSSLPMVIHDTKEHALFQSPEAQRGGMAAIAAFPIRQGTHVLGVLDVAYAQPHPFSGDELRLLELLADQAALSIDRAQLFAEANRRINQLATIARIGSVASSSLDVTEILSTTLDLVAEAMAVEAGTIFVLEQGKPTIVEAVGRPKEHARWDEDGVAAWVVSTGQPLRLPANDPSAVKGTPLPLGISLLSGIAPRSFLCVPIKAQGQVIGGIELVNRVGQTGFDPHDQELLVAVMATSAAAIENARLYQEMQKRLAESTALCSMASHTTGSLALEQVLDAIVQQLREVISCRAITVFLINEQAQELTIAAASGIRPEFRDTTRIKVGEGISGLVFQERRPINLRDVKQEAPDLGLDPRVNALLVVPLMAKSNVIGTLSVDSLARNAFTADHERLLTIVAAQAASAIENARLFQAERQRAEELARAYAELKELDRLKSQFVQNISHELRTPLTFVKGYADLLAEEAMGPLTPRQRQSIDIISKKTEAIIELVNGIITLQELEAVQTPKAQVSLSSVLSMVLDTARATAMGAGIETRNLLPDGKLWIRADEDRLIQVFDNLMGNAIKFSPQGGTITISATELPEHWQVAVQDTGIGIPQDKLEKIFDRFYQIDGSTTRRFGGAGLGLAIAKEIVQDHGGQIWAESTLGEGSTFYIKLPKHVASDREEQP